MNYLLVGMVLMAVIVVAVRRRKFFAIHKLRREFYIIEHHADLAMLTDQRDPQSLASTMLTVDDQSFTLNNGFRCAYWMTKTDEGIEHRIAGTMVDMPQKKLVQQMLQVMSELSSTFTEVGIQDKIKFKIASEDKGTHILSFLLNTSQHESFMTYVREQAPDDSE